MQHYDDNYYVNLNVTFSWFILQNLVNMIVFPNAKINVGLNIAARRSDGFHEISTLFYPVKELCDILEVAIIENQTRPLVFTQSGSAVDCDLESNLCVKAYHLFNGRVPLPPVAMHLHKIIPAGAGLGGGSSDAAFTLKVLNSLLENPLTDRQLVEFAAELGSDCPFFIVNSPCIGKGRGEALKPVAVDLSGFHLLLVNPKIHVNTGKAYSLSAPSPWETDIEILLGQSIDTWRNSIFNDFERVVFELHPSVGNIKHQMYRLGAVYAALSGSGSTVYGIFNSIPNYEPEFENYFVKLVQL